VITMEDWVTIRTLKAKNPKMTNREIARLIGISHHTVKTALASGDPPAYDRANKANPKLDPFREVIFEMANIKHFRTSRIINELRSKGYTGGKTAVYELLSDIKIDTQRHFTPYETQPGEHALFDWSPYTVLLGGQLTKIFVYSYINGFSRFRVYDVSLSEHQGAVLEALENGIIESGGVPGRVQVDNAKVFIINPSRNNFQWNARYLHFCGHYGFEPSRSLPSHPWSKGKVEKPFDYLETHFIAGASFTDFLDLATKLKTFQHTVNTRVHATLKTTPEELIGEDRKAFSPLPESRYVGVKEETRKVTSDCLLSFGGSRYSVPWPFAGKHVWVRLSKGYFLEVYSQANALIAAHVVATKKGSVVLEKAHYRTAASAQVSIERLRVRFREVFPDHEMFLEKLLAQKRYNARYHLQEILELSTLYCSDDFRRALDISLTYNVFTVKFISGYLEKHHRQSFDLPPAPLISRNDLPPVVTRNLAEYTLQLDLPLSAEPSSSLETEGA
jgi:transposase